MKKPVVNKKRAVVAAIVLVVLFGAIISNVTLKEFFLGADTKNLNYQTGIEYDALLCGKEVLIVNHEGIVAINRNGDEAWNIVCNTTTPEVEVENNYIMIADMNGKTINLYNKDKILTQIKTENEILMAKLNKHGYMAVATDELGYKGMLTVYDKDGNELFKWHSGAGYIGDIDISDKNVIAVSQLMTDKEKIYSRIIALDLDAEGEKRLTDSADGIVMNIKYRDNGELVAVSDSGVYGFKRNGKEKFKVDFKGRKLRNFNIDYEHNMVFEFVSGLNTTLFESYSAKGILRGSYNADSIIETFDVNGEYIVAAKMGSVTRLTPNGEVKSETTIGHNIKKIKIFPGRKYFIAIGDGMTKLMKIR